MNQQLSPSLFSLRTLDALNVFLADVQATTQNIGFVVLAAIAGLALLFDMSFVPETRGPIAGPVTASSRRSAHGFPVVDGAANPRR